MSAEYPNLIIIGAMKCATTSLHYYLSLHPEIFMPKIKELGYFIAELNWSRGADWYLSHFNSDTPVRGETTPGYTVYPCFAGVPERMHALIPDAKLVYIVRDPIDRIISQYSHNFTRGFEHRPLAALIESGDAEEWYIDRSRYYFQIEQYLPYYPPGKITILSAEELKRDQRGTLASLFRFLGVDDQFNSPNFKRIKHPTQPARRLTKLGRHINRLSERYLNRYQPDLQRAIAKRLVVPFSNVAPEPQLSEPLRTRLADALAKDGQKLRAFTGKSFAEWSI